MRLSLITPLILLFAGAGCRSPLTSKVPFSGAWEHRVENEEGELTQRTHISVVADKARFRIDEETEFIKEGTLHYTTHLFDGRLLYMWGSAEGEEERGGKPKVWVQDAAPETIHSLTFWLDRPKTASSTPGSEHICGHETIHYETKEEQPDAVIKSGWWLEPRSGLVLKKEIRVMNKTNNRNAYAASYECLDITYNVIDEEALKPPSRQDAVQRPAADERF